MHILDAREVNDEEGVYNALIHHIKYATNDGKVKPTITIFKQYQGKENNIRIYNHQLIRYAGYKTEMGVIGDSHSATFTDFVRNLVGEEKVPTLMYYRLYFLWMEKHLYIKKFRKRSKRGSN